MTTIDLPALLDEYAIAQRFSMALTDGLTSEQITWRPHENASAIAWHLGHQAAVNHYMVRNLTAAEVTFNAEFDRIFDSATPEPQRGELPPLDEVVSYRSKVAESTRRVIELIRSGEVGAPDQLAIIANGLLVAVINHEYQHATWIREVRDGMLDDPAPEPESARLVHVEGYPMLDLSLGSAVG